MQLGLGRIPLEGYLIVSQCLLVISAIFVELAECSASLWMGRIFGNRIEQMFFIGFVIAGFTMKLRKRDIWFHKLRASLLPSLKQTESLILSVLLR